MVFKEAVSRDIGKTFERGGAGEKGQFSFRKHGAKTLW